MALAPPGARAVVEALEVVRDRISRAGVDPERIRIVAVTKGFGVEAVQAALAAGLTDAGENYAHELAAKAQALQALPGVTGATGATGQPGQPNWHFLGPVQRNKVAAIAAHVGCWEAVDRKTAGEEIARRAPGATVLVQVATESLPDRPGCPPRDVPGLVGGLVDLGLNVQGLMTVAPPGGPAVARRAFTSVAVLADRLGLAERSMGMSEDLEVAVAEGATIVRLGRALFGERPQRTGPPAPPAGAGRPPMVLGS